MAGPVSYASQISVPLPTERDLRRVLGDAFDASATLNVVQMMAGTEDMFQPTIGLVRAVFSAQGVDPKLRQMIILRAAKVLNAPYEWQANVQLSLNNGLTQAHIDAAGRDDPVAGIEPEFVLVCRATDELSKSGTLSDATLEALLGDFGPTTTRKLILMIAWFNLLSLFLNGCRVPLETSDKVGRKKTPLG